MRAALSKAALQPEAVDYINAHGTSTMADVIELAAVERMMGQAASNLTMSSTNPPLATFWGLQAPLKRSSPFWQFEIKWRPQPSTLMIPRWKLRLIWQRMQAVRAKLTLPFQTHSALEALTPHSFWVKPANVAKRGVECADLSNLGVSADRGARALGAGAILWGRSAF